MKTTYSPLSFVRIDKDNYEANLQTADYYVERAGDLGWRFRAEDGDNTILHEALCPGGLDDAFEYATRYYLGEID